MASCTSVTESAFAALLSILFEWSRSELLASWTEPAASDDFTSSSRGDCTGSSASVTAANFAFRFSFFDFFLGNSAKSSDAAKLCSLLPTSAGASTEYSRSLDDPALTSYCRDDSGSWT